MQSVNNCQKSEAGIEKSGKGIFERYDLSKWLLPGIGIKRWIFLAMFSASALSVFSFKWFLCMEGGCISYSLAAVAFSLFFLGVSIARIILFIDNISKIAKEGHLEDYFADRKPRAFLPKIVMIGGGTGLSTLLRGVREYGHMTSSKNLSAIVTVADDGGSSGRLREEMNILPPGDIRNCLIALSNEEPLLARLFQYRFREGSELSGHSFGNLFIAAMTDITGDFVKTIKESSKVLAVSGKVLPSTVTPLELRAIYDDGSVVRGESHISLVQGKKIRKMEIIPENALALPEAITELACADAIIIGPGSLYTSLVPNLLIKGIREAINRSNALKVYICNVMTQPGETDGFDASSHIEVICGILGKRSIDYIIVSDIENATEELLERYKAQKAHPVKLDVEKLSSFGVKVVHADLTSYSDFLRHDPQKLANCVINIIKNSKA